ncbi:LysR family transcriptional regulator [Paucimonas lemoignei]|nr:LysR family transcriptional regulator [Paucimonas lemoignei]
MELVWLEDFNALAESANFSRAADLRHVTQPAFSRRIRALENWVGVELFERTAQGAVLTEAGRSMLENARELTRRLYQMRMDVREVAGKATRTLHFAATHSLSFTFFPAWIRSVERGAPIEAIRLHSDNMTVCEHMLLSGEVQFLLCHQHPDVPPRFESSQFFSKQVGHDVLRPLHSPDLDVIRPLPLLSYTAESGLGRIIQAHRQNHLAEGNLDVVFSSHLAAVLLSMACQAKGVAWLPHSLAETEISAGRLIQAGAELENIQTQIRLFRPKTPLSDFAEQFWDGLQEHD